MTDLSYVIRQGYVVCGVYKAQSDDTAQIDGSLNAESASADSLDVESLLRAESTAEHSARVANLFSEFVLWYPLYFQNIDRFIAFKVALCHDIGEATIGDVLDDGREEHETKKAPEWEAVKRFYQNLPDEIIERALDYHKQFDESETMLGQMLRMTDKVDAIGRLIIYEKMGLYGDVMTKNPPSEQDIKFAEEIGTSNCTDVWARHLQNLFYQENFRPQVVNIAKDFLTEGLRSINRPFFTWW